MKPKVKIVKQLDTKRAIPFYYIYIKYHFWGKWHNVYGCSDLSRTKSMYNEIIQEEDYKISQKKEKKIVIAKSY